MRLREWLKAAPLLTRNGVAWSTETPQEIADQTTVKKGNSISRRDLFFGLTSVGLLLVMMPTLRSLVTYAGDFDVKNASQVFLIPFVSLALLFFNRSKIFSRVEYAVAPAMLVAVFGAVLWFAAQRWGAQLIDGDRLGLEMGSLITLWIAAFLGFYGPQAFRAALFPLLFLAFSIPVPSVILDPLIAFLRRGSADISYLLLKMTGTPIYRQGFVFAMPRLTIEVAEECSGIRSFISMLILTVLAGNMLLESWWRRILLVVIALPVMLFKNALRITTLSLLSIHINPAIMESRLHREGGIPFFLVALVLLYPVAVMLIRSERRKFPRLARS
jgi:exosortase